MKINRGKLAQGEHDRLIEYSKSDLDKLIEQKDLVKDGKVTLKLQLLNLPSPTYEGDGDGSSLVRGVSAKDGKKSMQPVDSQQGADDHAEFEYKQIDFDEFIKYYQKLLLKDLDLPIIKKLHSGSDPKEEMELDDFCRDGIRCDLDLEMTLDQAYHRAFQERNSEPNIDPRIDGWYWEEKPTKQPKHNCLEVYVMDISGSVNGNILSLIRKMVFCLYYYLDKKYTKNVRRYILFEDNAIEANRDEFFSTETKGGTHISSGLNLALDITKGYEDYDKYLFFFSDFENASGDDNDSDKALNEIISSFTYVGMSQLSNNLSSSHFAMYTNEMSKQHDHVSFIQLTTEDQIKEGIYKLLTKKNGKS